MSIKIAIVDNHAIVRDGLKLIIELENDLQFLWESADGLEAINLVREKTPDVILMDISMPVMNGIESTKRILDEFPNVKIVILSMYGDAESIFRALKAGALGYLLKESVSNEVIDAIRIVNEGKRYLSQKVDETIIDAYVDEKLIFRRESPLDGLSSREKEVLQLVAEGKTSKEISEILFLSSKTVDTYRRRIMNKLGLNDITALIRFAIENKII